MAVPKKSISSSKKRIRKNRWKVKGSLEALKAFSLSKSLSTGKSKGFSLAKSLSTGNSKGFSLAKSLSTGNSKGVPFNRRRYLLLLLLQVHEAIRLLGRLRLEAEKGLNGVNEDRPNS
uniref:Large ribosomal subunit protein bL32c n=1 Tax=Monsonia emarginata TaxID=28966 RepID=A0A126TGX4_9ROSI|nr:ribosomal protein L32 [Monsonia emarginata]AML26884.1 ribosomal protein L32 [Monsonia emarginata]